MVTVSYFIRLSLLCFGSFRDCSKLLLHEKFTARQSSEYGRICMFFLFIWKTFTNTTIYTRYLLYIDLLRLNSFIAINTYSKTISLVFRTGVREAFIYLNFLRRLFLIKLVKLNTYSLFLNLLNPVHCHACLKEN